MEGTWALLPAPPSYVTETQLRAPTAAEEPSLQFPRPSRRLHKPRRVVRSSALWKARGLRGRAGPGEHGGEGVPGPSSRPAAALHRVPRTTTPQPAPLPSPFGHALACLGDDTASHDALRVVLRCYWLRNSTPFFKLRRRIVAGFRAEASFGVLAVGLWRAGGHGQRLACTAGTPSCGSRSCRPRQHRT